MSKNMPGRLVALSAAAVATIYTAGLFSTQPAAATVAATAAATPVVVTSDATPTSTAADPTSTPVVVVGASATPTPTSSTSTAASSSTYADGTYSATGTSALGNVTVSVTIAGDKITSVQITKVTTKFPVSRIASLPAQVIASQSANVNVVTGATYSSQAFKQAVQLALAQAQAANSATTVS